MSARLEDGDTGSTRTRPDTGEGGSSADAGSAPGARAAAAASRRDDGVPAGVAGSARTRPGSDEGRSSADVSSAQGARPGAVTARREGGGVGADVGSSPGPRGGAARARRARGGLAEERSPGGAGRARSGELGRTWPVQRLLDDAAALRQAARFSLDARGLARAVLTTDSFRILVMQRLREAARRAHVPLVNTALRIAQQVYAGVEIGKDVTLGDGVYFVHPVGVVIGGDARVGDRVRFYGSNTVGTAKDDGYPVIEDDVWIGAGARILGPVRIGARARIGANAVVLTDVPPDHVAVGVPARVLSSEERHVDLA
jgi:serine O-acetyltransferase